MIRECTREDSDWLMALAIECYDQFNIESSKEWLRNAFDNKNILLVRGKDAAALGIIVTPFWTGLPACELQFLCSRKTRFGAVELLHVVKYINDLRKHRGCGTFYLNSRLADLEPLALRLGAKLAGKSYILED